MFNCVSSRDNLPTIKDGAYILNLDEKQSKRTHWILLFIERNEAVYFDSFRIECISQEVLSKFKDKSINHNIFTIQTDDFVAKSITKTKGLNIK